MTEYSVERGVITEHTASVLRHDDDDDASERAMTSLAQLALTLTLLTRVTTSDGARILLYPFAHCENSHLLNMEKLVPILLQGGHDVTMLVPDTYTPTHHHDTFSQV